VSIFIAMGRKVGSTDIESPTEETIKARASDLLVLTKGMEESQLYQGIAEGEFKHRPMPQLLDPEIDGFAQEAPRLVGQVVDAAEERGARRVAGSLIFGRDLTEIRTNHGGGGCYEDSSYEITVRSFVDPESSGQGLACGRSISQAEERFLVAGRESADIATMAEGGTQGRPGKYDLIMSPTVGGNLLGQLAEGASPLMMMLGYSPLKDRLGEKLAPDSFSVVDDPGIDEGLGSRPFDVEGVPTRQVDLFREGEFVGMVHNTSTAKMMGGESTGSSYLIGMGGSKILGPWPSNLVFEGGDMARDEMIQECRKPTIYVTSNWYTRFSNYVEGIFSSIPRDGIFMVEDGEIKRPLRKIRISESILGLLPRLEAVGNDVTQIHWWEVMTPTYIPHMKFSDVNITAATM
jgi:PmbA protein